MITINIKNNLATGLFCCAICVATTSCSEFDDYNSVVADTTPSANYTLWENISQNPQLSDFASLVRRTGIDSILNQTHNYTVWAPMNGTFDAAVFQSLDDKALLRQFVKNHIASYTHRASGNIGDKVLMLNEKSYKFQGNGTYTFDDVALKECNLPNSNGLLHTLNGVAAYYPSLYEFVTDSILAKGYDIDSLQNFFLKYETTYLDTEHSVVGSIVNGMQTYVDSVMVTENTLWKTLNAKIQKEDSTYSFLLPTNKAWNSTYDKIKVFYNYLPTMTAQAFVGANIANANATMELDNAYWQDSLTTRYLTRNLIYSNNDGYNQWLVKEASPLGCDTLRSTTGNKLSNPTAILAETKQELKMSNGKAYLVDSLAFQPWETYAPEMIFRATSSSLQARVLTGYAQTVRLNNPDPSFVDLSKENTNTFSYLWVEPNGGFAKPELDIYLPDVRSTTYEFYCVMVPVVHPMGDTIPNRVSFQLNYMDANGKLQNYTFKDESEEGKQKFETYYEAGKQKALAEDPKAKFSNPDAATLTAFSNNLEKVDTMYIGEFTFPVSYYGLNGSDHICPNIKITSPFSLFNKGLLAAFSRDLCIAAIILKPKELAESEK